MAQLIKETIVVANLKCSGCANTIKKNLTELEGMEMVMVNHDTGEVEVAYDNQLSRESITKKLAALGYPEATEENGLLTQIKSYASCMIGKIQNKD